MQAEERLKNNLRRLKANENAVSKEELKNRYRKAYLKLRAEISEDAENYLLELLNSINYSVPEEEMERAADTRISIIKNNMPRIKDILWKNKDYDAFIAASINMAYEITNYFEGLRPPASQYRDAENNIYPADQLQEL